MTDKVGYISVNQIDQINTTLGGLKSIIDKACGNMRGKLVLDVGCGPASDTIRLSSSIGSDGGITGVDSDSEMIDEANRRLSEENHLHNIEHILGNTEALPFNDCVFDIVRCERVLQHVDNPLSAIAEMQRVLKPGCKLVVADTDHASLCIDTN